MNRSETIKQLSGELCNELIKILDNNLRSCINCVNFNQEAEICGVSYVSRLSRVAHNRIRLRIQRRGENRAYEVSFVERMF